MTSQEPAPDGPLPVGAHSRAPASKSPTVSLGCRNDTSGTRSRRSSPRRGAQPCARPRTQTWPFPDSPHRTAPATAANRPPITPRAQHYCLVMRAPPSALTRMIKTAKIPPQTLTLAPCQPRQSTVQSMNGYRTFVHYNCCRPRSPAHHRTTPPRRSRGGFETRPCPIAGRRVPPSQSCPPISTHPRPEMAADGRKNRNSHLPRPRRRHPSMTTALPPHVGHPDTQAKNSRGTHQCH